MVLLGHVRSGRFSGLKALYFFHGSLSMGIVSVPLSPFLGILLLLCESKRGCRVRAGGQLAKLYKRCEVEKENESHKG